MKPRLDFALYAVMIAAIAHASDKVVLTLAGCVADFRGAVDTYVAEDRASGSTSVGPQVAKTPVKFLSGRFAKAAAKLEPLSAREEFRRATRIHDLIASTVGVVDTPKSVESVLDRLASALPEGMRNRQWDYRVTVLDQETRDVFTPGGGYLVVSQSMVDELLQNEDALAFLLAQQVGHVVRGHCRRRYQLSDIRKRLSSYDLPDEASTFWRRRIGDLVQEDRRTGLRFHFDRAEILETDLFAIHLCRNAGFDIESGLDLLRMGVVAGSDDLQTKLHTMMPACESQWDRLASLLPKSQDSTVSQSDRLDQLRMDVDGFVPGQDYGLFEWDSASESFVRLSGPSLSAGERAVVCIHGMDSDMGKYRPFLTSLSQDERARDMRYLAFRYPNDQSLSRSAQFMMNNISQVIPNPEDVDFVCHSAGGLLFRYYHEVERGPFRRVIFQGTPHHGSSFANLRGLSEAREVLGDLHQGPLAALMHARHDGRGQIKYDLRPESLFLDYLNQDREQRHLDRYYIIRGQAIDSAALRRVAVSADLLRPLIQWRVDHWASRDAKRPDFTRVINRLKMPQELVSGDLAVSLESATIDGAAEVVTVSARHARLPTDEIVIQKTIAMLFQTN